MRRLLPIVAIAALASCSQSSGPGLPPQSAAAQHSCYVVKVAPATIKATITFYGWPDNSPPGDRIAHPVLHKVASGDGTYCNPTTFATDRKENTAIPYGIKIYVPFIKQYFIREDLCTHSGPPTGSGSNGCYKLWFDLWIGGTAKSKTRDVVRCERSLTPGKEVDVVLYPGDGLEVAHPGPIYRDKPPPNGTCDGKS